MNAAKLIIIASLLIFIVVFSSCANYSQNTENDQSYLEEKSTAILLPKETHTDNDEIATPTYTDGEHQDSNYPETGKVEDAKKIVAGMTTKEVSELIGRGVLDPYRSLIYPFVFHYYLENDYAVIIEYRIDNCDSAEFNDRYRELWIQYAQPNAQPNFYEVIGMYPTVYSAAIFHITDVWTLEEVLCSGQSD